MILMRCSMQYNFRITIPDTWAENSNRTIQRSQGERAKSAQLRTDADNLINECANNIWNSWNTTNSSLSRRATETLEAKNKLQMHLHKVYRLSWNTFQRTCSVAVLHESQGKFLIYLNNTLKITSKQVIH